MVLPSAQELRTGSSRSRYARPRARIATVVSQLSDTLSLGPSNGFLRRSCRPFQRVPLCPRQGCKPTVPGPPFHAPLRGGAEGVAGHLVKEYGNCSQTIKAQRRRPEGHHLGPRGRWRRRQRPRAAISLASAFCNLLVCGFPSARQQGLVCWRAQTLLRSKLAQRPISTARDLQHAGLPFATNILSRSSAAKLGTSAFRCDALTHIEGSFRRRIPSWIRADSLRNRARRGCGAESVQPDRILAGANSTAWVRSASMSG